MTNEQFAAYLDLLTRLIQDLIDGAEGGSDATEIHGQLKKLNELLTVQIGVLLGIQKVK